MTQPTMKSFVLSLEEDLYLRGEIHTLIDNHKKPTIILCHGFKGFKDWGFFPYAAEKLASEGYYVIRFNFSCNGVNKEDFDELDKFSINTYSREQADLTALLQSLKDQQLPLAEQNDQARVALIGHSRGGGNSLIFAADHPDISAVVTWNGIANVDLFDDKLKAEIRQMGIGYIPNARTKQSMPILPIVLEDISENQARFNIVRRISELAMPAFIIQGDQDSPRLVEGAKMLHQAAPQHLLLEIEGCNHTFGAVHPFQGTTPFLERAIQETLSFLKKSL